MGPMPGTSALFIEPAGSFGATLSVVWVFLVGWCVTGLFAFSLWRFIVYRSRSLRAASIARRPQALEEGPALLSGRVETDGGGPAVRIEIDQTGREWVHKSKWSHEWTEKGRAVHVQPFRLRTASDQVVRVIADQRVRLVDTLETEKLEGTYRRRVAELSSREQVWVSGVLAQDGQKGGAFSAYRAGPESLVLRGTAIEPLEVASGNLDVQFSYWRRFYAKATMLIGIVAFAVHGIFFLPFYALHLGGETEMAEVVKTSTYITSGKSRTRTHYVIHAKLPPKAGGHLVNDDVDIHAYSEAKNHTLTQVPFTYLPALPMLHSIGAHASLWAIGGIIALVLTVISWVVFFIMRRHAMPWYEQRSVVERGSGTLEARAWRKQVPGKPGLYQDSPLK